jgi:hypothetical protein
MELQEEIVQPGLFPQCQSQPGFFPIDGRARENAGFDGFVESGMNSGKKFQGLFFFSRGEQPAIIFFQSAQAGFNVAIVKLFAYAVSHPALG